MPVLTRRQFILGGLAGLLLSACGDASDDSGDAGASGGGKGLVAQVASYELVAGRDQRFIVGLFSNDRGMVSFGEVELSFSFLGTDGAEDDPRPGPTATAEFLPIPGQDLATNGDGPRYTSGAEARGVYGVDPVRFDEPGFWQVEVTAELDERTQRATAAFQVGNETRVPALGEPAPRTDNPRPGDPDTPPTAVDSRADADGHVPDPELHSTTVADAIAAGRPVMVVVSTPVFCVSRFCGPITDAVQELAIRHGNRMDFVHIEVWRDFESQELNEAAIEWIWLGRQGEAREPWVFLVGPDGTIVQRWDNVATEASLARAVDDVLATLR
ncbi:MAG TPA: hypothetical protein VFI46_02775 [Jiangellaceae bacterium]|nr:hypothetical protein [Jiangellaceae bacterium]